MLSTSRSVRYHRLWDKESHRAIASSAALLIRNRASFFPRCDTVLSTWTCRTNFSCFVPADFRGAISDQPVDQRDVSPKLAALNNIRARRVARHKDLGFEPG